MDLGDHLGDGLEVMSALEALATHRPAPALERFAINHMGRNTNERPLLVGPDVASCTDKVIVTKLKGNSFDMLCKN